GRFHDELMHGHVTLIGCPKLDATDYSEKLTGILIANNIRSITVARMNVPCCGGIENAVRQALRSSGKQIPWRTVTISTDGRRLN
ncbi:MAG: ferredoxin, partial [Oscillospiraceae bacterium]|nr:ferredoxin [Oscillospiraceae bacterium]